MSDKETSYRNTALLGASSVANILLSIVRNKVFAFYLGPTGIGQFGILNDFIGSVHSVGLLGVASSGVQAISKASTESGAEVRRVYATLMRVFSTIAIVLVAAVLALAEPISRSLGGGTSYALYLRIAAFALLFKFRSTIQGVLVTGMKRVALIARGAIYQGFLTTALGIALVVILRGSAVPFIILSLAFGAWVITLVQSRRVAADLPPRSGWLSVAQMSPLFALGLSSLWATILENVVNLINKSWITRYFDRDHLGYYQAAVGFTSAYIGFITSAIITNYYPNLVTKVQEGREATNDYVNQQLGISMALIMPLLFVMLTFSNVFLLVLFSSDFLAAHPLLSYTVAGTLIQVVAWPIAFVFLAHRATKTYILTESIGNGSMLILCYLAVRSGHFPFIGLAYLLHYVIYLTVITFLFYRRFGGVVSRENIALFVTNAAVIGAILVAKAFLSQELVYVAGSALIAAYLYRSRKEYSLLMRAVFRPR